MYQHVYYVLCFWKDLWMWFVINAWFEFDLVFMRNVLCWMWIGIKENNAYDNVLYGFKLWRLTLGIGNLMSSHSLSAGHVPPGLGRDKVGIRALAQFMHFQLKYLFSLLLRWLGSIMSSISLRCLEFCVTVKVFCLVVLFEFLFVSFQNEVSANCSRCRCSFWGWYWW